jgi:hypothetical protein
MCRLATIGFVALVVGFECWPAFAADSPLERIPDTALVVVRLKSPEATIKKVADFAGRINDDYKTFVTSAAGLLGNVISNPAQAGVDRKRDWWLVVVGKPGHPAEIVFGLPAADENAMKRALGEGFRFVSYKDFVFYTRSEHALDEFEALRAGHRKSAASALDRRLRALFDNCDLAASVNVRELRQVYRNTIDGVKQKIVSFAKQFGDANPAALSPGVDKAATAKLYADMISAPFQALEDAEQFACGINLPDKGVDGGGHGGTGVGGGGIDVQACFTVARSTPTDRFIERNPPSEMQTLGRLPADHVVYYGLAGDVSALVRWGATAAATMRAGNQRLQKQYAEASQALASLHVKGEYNTFSIGSPNEGVLWYTTVIEVDQPEKLRDIRLQLLEATAAVATTFAKTTVTAKPRAEKVGSHRVDLVTVKMEADSFKDPGGVRTGFMNLMYGRDGMVARFATLPQFVVESVGGGKPFFDALMHSLETNNGAARQPTWASVRANLPARANGIVLIDVPRLGSEVLRVLATLRLLRIEDAAVTELEQDLHASYLGIALATEPQGIRVKLHIPFEQAKGIARLIEFVRSELSRPR